MQSINLYSEINSYQPKNYPETPISLINFRNLNKEDQYDKIDKFYSQQYIQEYLEEKWKACLYNRDTFFRLYELYKDTQEDKEKEAICLKISLFKNRIIRDEKPFPALIIDFTKFKFEDKGQRIDWDE